MLSPSERQLVLASAGTAAHRQEWSTRNARLFMDINWPRLADVLRQRRLLPGLGPRITELTGERVDTGFSHAVEEALTASRRHAAFLQLTSRHVIRALAAAGISCGALKGPMLAEAIYGDPGRRLSSDVDLLAAPEQLQAAVDVVRSLGYEKPRDHVDERGLPKLHFLMPHARQALPPVELHWRVHYYEGRFAQERLLPPTPDPEGRWRPGLADELAALLLFYARDGFVDLRLAVDVSAWWDVHGKDLQPDAMEEIMRSFPELARPLASASEVAHRVVGVPINLGIEGADRLDLRCRIAVRLANPNPRASRSQLYADIGLIDGLLAPPGGMRAFLRRQVLLPREALAELDRRAPKRRARSGLSRAVGILGRYALSISRLALTPGARLR